MVVFVDEPRGLTGTETLGYPPGDNWRENLQLAPCASSVNCVSGDARARNRPRGGRRRWRGYGQGGRARARLAAVKFVTLRPDQTNQT